MLKNPFLRVLFAALILGLSIAEISINELTVIGHNASDAAVDGNPLFFGTQELTRLRNTFGAT